MSKFDDLMVLRLQQEFMVRIDAILTIVEANRRPAATRLYAELTDDISRYQKALERDSKYVRLFAMLSVLQEPTAIDDAILAHARRRWNHLRHLDEIDHSLQRLFHDL